MRALKFLGWGGSGLNTDLLPAMTELQGMRVAAVTGAGADTNMTLTGIKAGDYVLSIVNMTDGTNVSMAGLVITADNIKITADTTSKHLLVQWAPKA